MRCCNIPRLWPRIATLAVLAVAAALPACAQSGSSSGAPETDAMLAGKTVLVTGSTDGLGREVARRLGALGATVIVHGRNMERGRQVVASIESDGGAAVFYPADLGSLAEVERLAETVRANHARLDILINNAGIWTEGSDARRASADGHELTFAVNYLSHFLLTHALLPLIEQSAPARIINVASAAQQALDFDDVMLTEGFSATRAYSQSKLAQVLFTIDLAESLEGSGVTVNSLHPATLMDTSMVREAGIGARSTVDEGADAVMQLAVSPELEGVSGAYFNGLERARARGQAYDDEARAKLRALSFELTEGYL